MPEIIEKYGTLARFFEEAKKSIVTMEEKKKKYNLIKGKIITTKEELKKLEKLKNDTVNKITKERKDNIKHTYDQELVKLDTSLKKAKAKKEKEKQKIIKEKIGEGTKTKTENILYLKNNIKSILEENKINPIVNSKIYFDIVAPRKVTEYIKGALWFVVFFALVPVLIVLIFQSKMTFWSKVMTFVINTFFFGMAYLILCHVGRCDKSKQEEIRDLRYQISDLEKDIKKISKTISKEKIEDNQEYTKCDREIETIKLSIKDLKEKEQKSLETFENSTKNEIANKIEKESKKDFDANKKELDNAEKELADIEKEISEYKEYTKSEFIDKIGEELYTKDKIESLISIVSEDSSLDLEKALKLAKK